MFVGRGVFASKDIDAGSYVLYYAGRRVTKEPDGDDTYVFEVKSGRQILWYVLDHEAKIKYIVSCRPPYWIFILALISAHFDIFLTKTDQNRMIVTSL